GALLLIIMVVRSFPATGSAPARPVLEYGSRPRVTPVRPGRRMVAAHQRRGCHMATYITLLKYTDQGIKSIKEGPSRLEKAKQALKSMGGEVKSFHLVQGRYDAIVFVEAP